MFSQNNINEGSRKLGSYIHLRHIIIIITIWMLGMWFSLIASSTKNWSCLEPLKIAKREIRNITFFSNVVNALELLFGVEYLDVISFFRVWLVFDEVETRHFFKSHFFDWGIVFEGSYGKFSLRLLRSRIWTFKLINRSKTSVEYMAQKICAYSPYKRTLLEIRNESNSSYFEFISFDKKHLLIFS